MSYCVYRHVVPNGKYYIGITNKDPLRRWKNGFGYRENQHFFNAILKYGWDNIGHDLLFIDLTKEEACRIEQFLIALYKSNDPDHGYNHTSGGEYFEHNEETRQKMSEAGKLRTGEKNGFYGKTHSEESCKRMSEALKGKQAGEKHYKARKVLNVETEEVFLTVSFAAKAYHTQGCHIAQVCNGTRKRAGGHSWRYIDE